jgi:FMN phosphatase YigB (HAD superfamily)
MVLEVFAADPEQPYMVGDSVEPDIWGSIAVGVNRILYDPAAQQQSLFGVQIPVICHMRQPPEHFGV